MNNAVDAAHRVVCNPMDLAYRFQDARIPGLRRRVFREAADPSVVLYDGRYYLFASMSGGFWHSEDLVAWQFQPVALLPAFDYAPDVRVIDDALYVMASRAEDTCPIFRSSDPLGAGFTHVADTEVPVWDPNLFQDDDGAVYLYWGCSNSAPITGQRVRSGDFRFEHERADLLAADTGHRGWERTGEDNVYTMPTDELERMIAMAVGNKPFIEGAWMTKHNGRYYLQYSAPGTEYNVYADGYATSASPLGPFEYDLNSPFSSKPGGFVTAAGHGSTFQDAHGNWWHASTMRVSVNHSFERRVGLFPAGFDEDGVLFSNQNFADFPMIVHDRKFDPWTESFAGAMLLSFRASSTASSSTPGHGPELATNEDIRTWWTAASADPGEWLTIDLGQEQLVSAIQVNLADESLTEYAPELHQRQEGHEHRGMYDDASGSDYRLELSSDGETWVQAVDARAAGGHSLHSLVAGTRARFVRFISGRSPFDAPVSVCGLRVFGLGEESLPVSRVPEATRVDSTSATVRWDAADDAVGYNVRYGSHPEKLYHSWMVFDQAELTIRTLNSGADYWFAVDAFNTSGVTTGTTVASVTA